MMHAAKTRWKACMAKRAPTIRIAVEASKSDMVMSTGHMGSQALRGDLLATLSALNNHGMNIYR